MFVCSSCPDSLFFFYILHLYLRSLVLLFSVFYAFSSFAFYFCSFSVIHCFMSTHPFLYPRPHPLFILILLALFYFSPHLQLFSFVILSVFSLSVFLFFLSIYFFFCSIPFTSLLSFSSTVLLPLLHPSPAPPLPFFFASSLPPPPYFFPSIHHYWSSMQSIGDDIAYIRDKLTEK